MPPPLQRPPRAFRPLPGRWLGVATKARAWLATDHLLYVERAWFTERYCRLYFRDIEAVLMQPTPNRGRWAAAGAAAGLAGLALALPPALPPAARLLGAAIAVPAVIGSAVNWLRGPTCATTVRTRVSDVRLRCWHRRRVAEKSLGRLSQAIAAVQGVVPPSSLETGLMAAAGPPPVPPAAPAAAPPPLPAPAGAPKLTAAASLVLLAEAAVAAVAIPARTPLLIALLGVTTALLLPLAVALMVRLPDDARSGGGRRWTMGLFGYWTVRGLLLYIAFIIASAIAGAREAAANPGAMVLPVGSAFSFLTSDHVAGAAVCAAMAIASASLGAIGLMRCRHGA